MTLSNRIPEATGCKSPEQTNVGKLLLNAWSAELALCIKPTITDRDFLNAALTWAFPEAYYATLFSARAVLAVDAIGIANPETIEKLLNKWADNGLYGSKFNSGNSPLTELLQYRLNDVQKGKLLSGPEAAAMHVKLTNKVHALAIIHETYILNRMGAESYKNLVESSPEYLKNGFVGARATFLLSND